MPRAAEECDSAEGLHAIQHLIESLTLARNLDSNIRAAARQLLRALCEIGVEGIERIIRAEGKCLLALFLYGIDRDDRHSACRAEESHRHHAKDALPHDDGRFADLKLYLAHRRDREGGDVDECRRTEADRVVDPIHAVLGECAIRGMIRPCASDAVTDLHARHVLADLLHDTRRAVSALPRKAERLARAHRIDVSEEVGALCARADGGTDDLYKDILVPDGRHGSIQKLRNAAGGKYDFLIHHCGFLSFFY